MKEGKLHGLDLFSGIGGLSKALEPWVETVAYCERDEYAQSVLLSRMLSGDLDAAPIWDDVTTLRGADLPSIDIIFGGFPCQDISVAGDGAGLAGARSGLFFEILRLVDECKPAFVFLENVPAIRTRGLGTVVAELAARRYDCRWHHLSAAQIGAPHIRDRWFLLSANTECLKLWLEQGRSSGPDGQGSTLLGVDGTSQFMADTAGIGWREGWPRPEVRSGRDNSPGSCATAADFWAAEPDVDRVVNGLPHRVDRIRCLGNAVVPLQAQEAFKELMGLNT